MCIGQAYDVWTLVGYRFVYRYAVATSLLGSSGTTYADIRYKYQDDRYSLRYPWYSELGDQALSTETPQFHYQCFAISFMTVPGSTLVVAHRESNERSRARYNLSMP